MSKCKVHSAAALLPNLLYSMLYRFLIILYVWLLFIIIIISGSSSSSISSSSGSRIY